MLALCGYLALIAWMSGNFSWYSIIALPLLVLMGVTILLVLLIIRRIEMVKLHRGALLLLLFRAFLVALEEATEKVVGYAGLLVMADEGYITNVAVFPEYRRQGIAGQLLEVFLRFAQANALAFLTLEVRPSNDAAIALYQGYGFEEKGRRKNYYDFPKEDALILTREFGEQEAAK